MFQHLNILLWNKCHLMHSWQIDKLVRNGTSAQKIGMENKMCGVIIILLVYHNTVLLIVC